MFETTAVEARPGNRSAAAALTLPISIAIHAFAVTGALFVSAWNVDLPETAPRQMRAFTLASQIPIPPAGSSHREQPETRAVRPPSRPAEPTAPARVSENTDISTEPIASTTIATGGGDTTSSESPFPGTGNGTGDRTGDGDGEGDGKGVGPGTGDAVNPVPLGPFVPGGNVKSPEIVSQPDPHYPDSLRMIRFSGYAIVECIIGIDGMPRLIEVKKTNHPLFGQSAVQAVQKWRFKPGTLDGRPVETILQLKVDFQLR